MNDTGLGERSSPLPAAAVPVVALRGITVSFARVPVLRDVDFVLQPGEVHALFGANGAGKSTLARVLTGQLQPDAGRIELHGQPRQFTGPRVALRAGIAMVSQETSLAPDLSVAENIVLPLYGTKQRGALAGRRAIARRALEQLGITAGFDLDAPVALLSAASRQTVEIAKALALDARVIVFDEPTTALSPAEVARLFGVMRSLRAAGRSMVFVSHRLEELFAITDRMTVLRDGAVVAQGVPTSSLTQTELVRLMVGREVAALARSAPTTARRGTPVLEVRGLQSSPAVREVSFTLHAGEILGLGGLVGAGRSETAEALYGLRPVEAGEMRLNGKPYRPKHPVDALRAGLGFVAEDRRRHSIVPDFSVMENLLLACTGASRSPLPRHDALKPRIDALARHLDLPVHRLADESLLRFSGGMQQKVLIMRCLLLSPRVLILDEPTKGVDIGARAAIYALLREVAADGVAVLLISSDFEELLALSDRVVPISDGCSIGSVPAQLLDEQKLLLLAAPRSSLRAQRRVLDEAAASFDAESFWAVLDADGLICLAAGPAAEETLGFGAGAVCGLDASKIPAALRADGDTFVVDDASGRCTLLSRVVGVSGHDLGRIGISLAPGAPPPSPEAVRRELARLAEFHLSGAVRILP